MSADSSSLFQPAYLGNPVTVDPTSVAPWAASQGSAPVQQGAPAQGAQSQGTTATAAQLDPNMVKSLGPQQTIDQIIAGAQPGFASANRNLSQMLANFGVGGGQAISASEQLQAQLMAALAPTLAGAIQNSQGNQLNAGEFDTGNNQATGLFNAGQGQQNQQFNAAQGQQNSQFNANQGQQNQQFNAAQNQQNNQFNSSGSLQAALTNAAAGNNASQYNANAYNATNAANVGQQNQSQQQLIQQLLNEYYTKAGMFNQINTGGQNAGNQNAINYGQDITTTPDPFAQVFGGLVQGAQAAAPFLV